MNFDTARFLREKFNSAAGLYAFLKAYRQSPPSLETVQKWFQRSSIPSVWLPVLIAYLELDEGGPIRLSSYLLGERNDS